MTNPEIVREIVEEAGGKIIGKTRLQKSVYLLEAAGVGFGFDFNYHYYGPYSEELAVAAADAAALDLIRVDTASTRSGASYSIFEADESGSSVSKSRVSEKRRQILSVLQRYEPVSLELAATAHFLSKNGFAENPWKETERRKSAKAKPVTVEDAKRLLTELDLQPAN